MAPHPVMIGSRPRDHAAEKTNLIFSHINSFKRAIGVQRLLRYAGALSPTLDIWIQVYARAFSGSNPRPRPTFERARPT
jgi:hypothetical protein